MPPAFRIFDPPHFWTRNTYFPAHGPVPLSSQPLPFTLPWPSDERRRRVVASEPYRWLSCPSLLACSFVSCAGCKQEDIITSIMLLINEHIAGPSNFTMNDVCICVSIETIGTEVRGVAKSVCMCVSVEKVSCNFCVRICALS